MGGANVENAQYSILILEIIYNWKCQIREIREVREVREVRETGIKCERQGSTDQNNLHYHVCHPTEDVFICYGIEAIDPE